jgi:hypothetical protein
LPDGINILVQPSEMHPTAVAMCTELNDLVVSLLAAGVSSANREPNLRALYLRGDAYAGRPEVQKVALSDGVSVGNSGAWYAPGNW